MNSSCFLFKNGSFRILQKQNGSHEDFRPGFERRIYKTKKIYEKWGNKLEKNIITYTYIHTHIYTIYIHKILMDINLR